jgi:AcrR family transcriptional regulator
MSPRPRVGLELTTILEAAADLANQSGMHEVTLANLAKKLHIRPPSLYNHFDGLPGLRKQMAIYGIEKLYDDLTTSAIGVSGMDALLSLSKAYIRFARNYPGLYEATLMAPDPEEDEVQQAGAKIVHLTVLVLRSFQLEGHIALHAVRGLRSLLHGFASLEQNGGFKMELDLDESVEIMVKAFINGMKGI